MPNYHPNLTQSSAKLKNNKKKFSIIAIFWYFGIVKTKFRIPNNLEVILSRLKK